MSKEIFFKKNGEAIAKIESGTPEELKLRYLDWESPRWDSRDIHFDWKNYVTESLKLLWPTFSDDQKKCITLCLQEIADNEDLQ